MTLLMDWISWCHLILALGGGRDSTAPCTTWRTSSSAKGSRVDAVTLPTTLFPPRDKKGANRKFWRKFKKFGLKWLICKEEWSNIRIRSQNLAYHRLSKTAVSPSLVHLDWASITRALPSSWATRRTNSLPKLRTTFEPKWMPESMRPTRTELRPLVIWSSKKWVSPKNHLPVWTWGLSTRLTSFHFPSFRGKLMNSVWDKPPAISTRSTKQLRFWMKSTLSNNEFQSGEQALLTI